MAAGANVVFGRVEAPGGARGFAYGSGFFSAVGPRAWVRFAAMKGRAHGIRASWTERMAAGDAIAELKMPLKGIRALWTERMAAGANVVFGRVEVPGGARGFAYGSGFFSAVGPRAWVRFAAIKGRAHGIRALWTERMAAGANVVFGRAEAPGGARGFAYGSGFFSAVGPRALPLCLAASVLLSAPLSQAHDDARVEQRRALFVTVENALKAGDRGPFRRHREALADYPLYPYLLYQDLRYRLARADDSALIGFLEAYAGETPVAERLRHQWLTLLARRGRWGRFLEYYGESVNVENKDNRCYYAHALVRAGRLDEAGDLVRSLWLVNFSQPPACDPVFRWGLGRGVIGDDLVWERLLLVWKRGETALADYLGGRLRGDARHWVSDLRRARRHPRDTALKMRGHVADSRHAGDVMVFALRRLAARDAVEAGRVWNGIKRDCEACLALRSVEKDIGLAAAGQLAPAEAYRWLSRLPPRYRDDTSRRWRVRAALRMQSWRRVLASIDDLGGEDRGLPQWRYWRARALAELGQRDEARRVWEQLAQKDGYYGYLAADRLTKPYPHELGPLEFTASEMAALNAYPAVARMRELWALERPFDANRELLALLERVDARVKLKIAVAAGRWRWPTGAIHSLSDSIADGHLLQRFPMPYRGIVEAEARRHRVPMEWIYAVMRRESAFVEQIRSPAGALGLMQLRPRTARAVAARLGLGKVSNHGILSPKLNVRLGTAYLEQLYRNSGHRLAVSLAGYNAGPTNARRWLNNAPVAEGAVWVDTIPFKETRLYVRAVLFYALVYRHRLGKPPVRLRDLTGF